MPAAGDVPGAVEAAGAVVAPGAAAVAPVVSGGGFMAGEAAVSAGGGLAGDAAGLWPKAVSARVTVHRLTISVFFI